MQQHQPQGPGMREQFAGFVSWLAFFCQVFEASVAVFLRRGFGQRYFGLRAAVVVPLVLVYSTLWPEHDPEPMLVYLGLFVLGCAFAQGESNRRSRRGEIEHSHYSGRPQVMRWRLFRGRLSERNAKGVVEPVIVLITGCFLMEASEPLGTYLMLAAVGLILSIGFARAAEIQQLADARDAYIEQQHIADRFRDGHWR